ncbi:hypothetical protein Fot_41091 [Forsythia ovata]|uniref:Uncharacterized protein n=1 Tax=Forsythia ovata TaxID=205694 RepID=A0ABD1RIB3_9LAMI
MKRGTIVQKVLPRYLKSYTTSTREVLPNLYEEINYRPRGHISIFQMLPQYIRSYLTSKKRDTISMRSYLTPTKMDTIVQDVLPQYIRFYLDISGHPHEVGQKKDTIVQEVLPQYIKSYLNISGPT